MERTKRMAGMEITHVLSSMDFQPPRLTVACPSAAAETNTASSQWPHSLRWVITHLPSGRLITLDHCNLGRGNLLLLLEHTLTLDMDLPSLHAMPLSNPPFAGLSECIIHYRGIPYCIASHRGVQFIAKEVLQWAHAYGIQLSHNVSYHLKVAGLLGWWSGFWKTQLLSQLGGNTFQDRGNVL